jgi:high-affinity iron transporter
MLLSSVTLILQETLEAALLVSVLLVISHQQQNKSRWLLFGIAGGMLLSFLYAGYMVEISEWFDYVGQEIVTPRCRF